MKNNFSILFVMVIFVVLSLAVSCGGESEENQQEEENSDDAAQQELDEIDDCEVCLEAGGTWQPEATTCTENCDLMDISCYTDECPGECEESCDNCFGQDECEAQGCIWNQEAEAMWCTDSAE